MTCSTALENTARGRYAHLPALTGLGLIHGFSCRDLGAAPGMRRAGTAESELAGLLGLDRLPRARLNQQHTARVLEAGDGPNEPAPVGDALVARRAGVVLRLRTADCLPLLLLDVSSGHYGVVHAGWRGTRAAILGRTLEALYRAGSAPDSTWMAIGPGIRACCYEVGDDVLDTFRAGWPEDAPGWLRPGGGSRHHLDLAAANRRQAAAAGIAAEHILDSGWCTRCRGDLFFSHRGDGGATGRIITLACRPPESRPER